MGRLNALKTVEMINLWRLKCEQKVDDFPNRDFISDFLENECDSFVCVFSLLAARFFNVFPNGHQLVIASNYEL